MKVIEAQSAVLSNYEVHQHLVEQRKRGLKEQRRGPSNLATATKALLGWLQSPPQPLSQKPLTYTPESISTLLERLRPYDLSKGEIVMILNIRPDSVAALNTVIEHMADRFSAEQQEDIMAIIAEVLGQFPKPDANADGEEEADGGENGEADVSIADNKA